MNGSGISFHLCLHSTSAISVAVGSCYLPSTWIAELQTGERKKKSKSFKTAVGLSDMLDIMHVSNDQIRN